MNNADIYLKNPATTKLVNEGVVQVTEETSDFRLSVLRYELETFVCEGQYQQGMEHLLETYLKNIDQAQQPAVWISGFFGSGKSHLVKMLRAFWVDTEFKDGATARGIANLPQNIKDLLKELSTQGKRHGGLHAASGTLGAGASGSVRLALLRIVFQSVGLPEHYPAACFVMWLENEDILEEVKNLVESSGYDWQEELDNFYVAEGLHNALVQAKPNLFSSVTTCVETLNNLYPYVQDVSNDDMIKAVRQALTRDGKFPLTLIALDEVQQFIGQDSQRSNDVQEVVEACCKSIGGKLLFIGTGQTAVTDTSNLRKLEGRFTVRIELSDADVDAVIRKVILAKKPESIGPIDKVMQTNLGEISRHLSGTTIGHRQDDTKHFAQDYPILPVRRRFWENTLRVLDPTGTHSQLRNQLSMIHKVIQTNLDKSIGNVVPADYLYFDSADKLLQSRMLPRKIHEHTMSWIKGSNDEVLMARACGLVFLINKLAGHSNPVGIHATVDTIADLMVEDLAGGSSSLRNKLPNLLDGCELLMKVGEEYRIQTEESAAWHDEFSNQQNQLANEAYRLETERNDRIRHKFGDLVKKLSLTQGKSKVSRDLFPVFESQLPTDSAKKVCVWIRDGWSIDENSVQVEAKQGGNQSPTIFVFLPKRSADDLRHNLIDFKAASATLDIRGVPSGPEGTEARAAMETTKQTAEARINEILGEAFSGARVFQSGGNEIIGGNLQESITLAAENSLQRLYPQFHVADHPSWDRVYSKAKQGSPDALKVVGDDGEPSTNPVCKAILSFIGGGKKGTDIRNHFEGEPFGWPRDAVDGGLQVLLVAGSIRASDDRGKAVNPQELERKDIGKVAFKVESTTVSTAQRIQVRKLLQKLGCQAKQGEELAAIPDFLLKMESLASRAGGEPPKPEKPDTSLIDDIRTTAGNEQILALYNGRDELTKQIDEWSDLAKRIDSRWLYWVSLNELIGYARNVKAADEAGKQAEAIKHQRLLLNEPDPVQPLLKSLEDTLRKELVSKHQLYTDTLQNGERELEADSSWKELSEDERQELLQKCGIGEPPPLSVSTHQDLVRALNDYPINAWDDRIGALPGKFACALEEAAKALEPETQAIVLPRKTLKTEADIEAWIEEVKAKLKAALGKGPIILR